MGTLTIHTLYLRREDKTYQEELIHKSFIVIPAADHQFERTPFLYQFYVDDEHRGVLLYTPDFENPHPYGYDDAGNIFFKLIRPFTGVLVLKTLIDTTIKEPQ